MVADNISAGLMTLFLGSIGDVISRVLWYNCSIDKPWTLLFFLPPLSIVPSIFYFLDKIEKGEMSCGEAVDWFLLAIPLMTIALNFLYQSLMDDDGILTTLLTVISIFVLYAFIRMYKSYRTCDIIFKERNTGFSMNHVGRAFVISLITNVVIFGFNSIAPLLEFIPVIGMAFSAWGYLDYLPGAQHALLLTFSHYITNLTENMPSTLEKLCTTMTTA